MTAANPDTEGETPAVAAAEKPDSLPEWRTDVILQFRDWEETRSLIESFRGRVVVVDVWSTACEPCLREFPHLVALQNELPEDVVCIGLNCDFAGVRKKPPEFYRERVTKVLADKQAHIVNVMCTRPADELFVTLKIDSIPAAFVYDREGALVAKFDNTSIENGEFTYADHVVPVVRNLVGVAENAIPVSATE